MPPPASLAWRATGITTLKQEMKTTIKQVFDEDYSLQQRHDTITGSKNDGQPA